MLDVVREFNNFDVSVQPKSETFPNLECGIPTSKFLGVMGWTGRVTAARDVRRIPAR